MSDEGRATSPAKARRKLLFKWMKRIHVLFGTAFILGVVAGYQPTGFDDAVLVSDDTILVTRGEGLLMFSPKHAIPSTALLLLPGALVAPDAYAPLARDVAGQGYRVSILSLPLRLAPTQTSSAGVIARIATTIKNDPSIQNWVLAGHSKGGLLAARFAHEHPTLLDGLILLGTSHPRRDLDLSHTGFDVTKIYATCDGLASPEEVEANRKFLPPRTHLVRIDGGNHTQFAYYRFQLGDQTAKISRSRQQEIVVKAILLTLRRVETKQGEFCGL